MIAYFKDLFTDKTVFVGVVRAALGYLAVVPDGAFDVLPAELKPIALAIALFVRSSSSAPK